MSGEGDAAFPMGAIENGRAFIHQLEANYGFRDDGRPLSTNAEWGELKRCFEYMAEYLLHYREGESGKQPISTAPKGIPVTRYYLNGFFMHKAEDGKHYAASTDGHMLTRVEVNPAYDTPAEFPSVIFPAAVIKQIEGFKPSVLVRDKTSVTFHVDARANVYRLEWDGQSFSGKLIDGTYPDYSRVIPAGWESYTNEYGKSGFSPIYLAAILKAASYSVTDFKATVSPVRMFFSGESPAVIQEAKDPGVLYVIMPMRAPLKEHRHPVDATAQEPATAA